MSGEVIRESTASAHIARVVLRHPGKLNAISVAMWRQLRALFVLLQAEDPLRAPRAVIVCGEGGHFAAGADIAEFPEFRFAPDTLRDYHENVIAPALQAALDCDIPLVAQIEGPCVGGGLEIAACCDLRIAARDARFGVPIARLGFPMAPGELLAVRRVVGDAVLRELLLEARLFDADAALARGLLHRVVDDARAEAWATAERIAELSPQAARLNKRSLRALTAGGLSEHERAAHFTYAGHAEHREGVAAFLAGRPARF
jgi:enoyl-CoA hydratase/carnithine racemase